MATLRQKIAEHGEHYHANSGNIDGHFQAIVFF
jgi:hypothetical protein